MNVSENSALSVSEECVEMSQRIHKALRFGFLETQIGKQHNNAERLEHETIEMLASWDLAVKENPGMKPFPGFAFGNLSDEQKGRFLDKQDQLRHFRAYSREHCGTITK
jgi:hypothetical protein